MSKNIKLSLTLIVLLALGLAGGAYWCWKIRLTPESIAAAKKEVVAAVRSASDDDVAAVLRKYAFTRHFHTRFDRFPPYMHVAWEPKVPVDLVAQLAENTFLRFSGNGKENSEDIPHLKQMMAFAEDFIKAYPDVADASAIKDRLLDGHFIIGDFDTAISMLEAGIPGHEPDWLKITVVKVKGHRAMALANKPGLDAESVKKAKREAIKHFTAFGDYMLTDDMKDFEESDPTTGILYSFEWVAIKNFMRSVQLAREIGDTAVAEELTARSKKLLESARKKAKSDMKSSEAFEAEMKSYGL